jgi:hypothetical protein
MFKKYQEEYNDFLMELTNNGAMMPDYTMKMWDTLYKLVKED